jgi:hypothetical protein
LNGHSHPLNIQEFLGHKKSALLDGRSAPLPGAKGALFTKEDLIQLFPGMA